MKHAREDYNRIQDPALDDPSLLGEGCSPIGEDEPVFLLRAKDAFFYHALEEYASLVQNNVNVSDEFVDKVREHARAGLVWQAKNGCKVPDLPGED